MTTGIVRRIVPVPVVIVANPWSGAGALTVIACVEDPVLAVVLGRAGDLPPISWRLKLNPCRRLLAEAPELVPVSAPECWCCTAGEILEASRLWME